MEISALDILEKIVGASDKLSGWGLSIVGGSIVALISSSYLKPTTLKAKQIYLLFVPGWIFIFLSLYYGNNLMQDYIGSLFYIKNETEKFYQSMLCVNKYYSGQIRFFVIGLVFFATWLIAILLWWIYNDSITKRKEK
jgi:hypothetical protein